MSNQWSFGPDDLHGTNGPTSAAMLPQSPARDDKTESNVARSLLQSSHQPLATDHWLVTLLITSDTSRWPQPSKHQLPFVFLPLNNQSISAMLEHFPRDQSLVQFVVKTKVCMKSRLRRTISSVAFLLGYNSEAYKRVSVITLFIFPVITHN